MRVAVQVIGGAVERVDNPFVFEHAGTSAASICSMVTPSRVLLAQIAAFFAAHEIGGIAVKEGVEQNRFGLAVDIGNKIVKRFAVYFNGIRDWPKRRIIISPALRAALNAVFKIGFMVLFLSGTMRRTAKKRCSKT